jgi:pimeloyl-ACP methyl ester carboxylesterase
MRLPSRNGLNLHSRLDGRGDPPFLFIHGWCCDHTFFQPQFDHFRASHAVATLDLRGCGKSDRPEHGYDIPTFADDVAWLCGQLGIAKPVLVGHSLGGMIAIEIAARYPGLHAAVVALDPGPIDPLPQARQMFESLAEQLEGPDGEAARRAYVDDLFLPTDDAGRKRSIVEAMGSVPLAIAAETIRGVVSWNGVGALLLCKAPLLVVRSRTGGSNDPARLLALKPDVQIGVTVGAGHFHQLEVPEQVTPMIERFVRNAVWTSAGGLRETTITR